MIRAAHFARQEIDNPGRNAVADSCFVPTGVTSFNQFGPAETLGNFPQSYLPKLKPSKDRELRAIALGTRKRSQANECDEDQYVPHKTANS